MAEDEGEGGEGAPEAKPKKKIPIGTLLVLLNTFAVLAALGMAVYFKILWKRPEIVEAEERAKLAAEAKKKGETPIAKVFVNIDQFTVNIAQTSGKAHFATIALAIECQDAKAADAVTQLKPALVDKIITALARRQITELNTIQGKLLLKTELMREFNDIVEDRTKISAAITDILYPNFILQ